MTSLLIALFWTLLAVPLIAFVCYPTAAALAAKFGDRLPRPRTFRREDLPPVTLVISAYNEATAIGDRLRNALALDYPEDKLSILVVSDGSTDGTDAVVRAFEDERIMLLNPGENLGKSYALRLAVDAATTDLMVFTDANSEFHPQALRRLIRWFSIPEVGAVCGRLTYTDWRRNVAACEEMRYWSWDTRIKRHEGCIGAILGGNGSIIALRRYLAEPIPAAVANDLAWLNMVRLRGLSVAFEARAVAYEASAGTMAAEFRRRVRIITRGWNGIAHSIRFAASLPASERASRSTTAAFFTQLVAKKMFRYLAFPAMLAAMCLVPFLPFGTSQLIGMALWAGLLGATGVGLLQPAMRRFVAKWPNPIYALALACSSIIALANVVRGRQLSRWTTHRTGATPVPVPQRTLGRRQATHRAA